MADTGTVSLPADYVRERVRLGYAATEPGNQSDTQTGSITLATPATTGRGLYVAVTRGEQENLILTVTETHDIAEARDVLETIIASDRADIPAVTQRRQLAEQHHQAPGRKPKDSTCRGRLRPSNVPAAKSSCDPAAGNLSDSASALRISQPTLAARAIRAIRR